MHTIDTFQNYVTVITTYFRHFHWGQVLVSRKKTIDVMAEEQVVELMEADIPGASLGERHPEKFKIAELKFWLRCRSATGPTKLKTKAASCLQLS